MVAYSALKINVYKFFVSCFLLFSALVVKLADTTDLGSVAARHGGSSPPEGTSSNLFGIKNMERFCGSQNRALIFAKTLSAYGGSREIP